MDWGIPTEQPPDTTDWTAEEIIDDLLTIIAVADKEWFHWNSVTTPDVIIHALMYLRQQPEKVRSTNLELSGSKLEP